MTEIYRKGFNGLTKDVDTAGRIVTGYFSTFNFKDSDGDIILPGAFKKTIRERGPKGKKRIFHLWQHYSSEVIGKPNVLKEDETGLYFETAIADTTLGNDTLKLYEQGILTEHSIGFNSVVAERDNDKHITYLKELKLWEGSTVTWGANERAQITGMKGNNPDELLKRIDRIEKAMRNGTYTDETFELLQIEIDYIKQSLKPDKPLEPTDEELINSFKLGLNG